MSPTLLLLLLPDPPALVGVWPAARVRLDVRTLRVSPVWGGPGVSAGRSPAPHTGTARLPARVEELPWDPRPVPLDAATPSGAPEPAALGLVPLHVTGREHLLLHVILVSVSLSLCQPVLQVPPVLCDLPGLVVIAARQDSHLPVVRLVEVRPLGQAQVVSAGQTGDVWHQPGRLEVARDKGSAGVTAGKEAVAAARPVVLSAARDVIDNTQQGEVEARAARTAVILGQLRHTEHPHARHLWLTSLLDLRICRLTSLLDLRICRLTPQLS